MRSLLLCLAAAWSAQAETVVESHEIGPWPVVSRLIGYGDRLWLVNSVKGVNHNSADLHSIPVEGGAPRYEGHLFSQDAGHPVVHRGLLYWPLEDARSEPGIAAFDVTDGERWEHALIPTEQAFHNHAMVASGDRLYAAPSAWKGSVALSEDGGTAWRTVYLHPTPDRRVSRIVRSRRLQRCRLRLVERPRRPAPDPGRRRLRRAGSRLAPRPQPRADRSRRPALRDRKPPGCRRHHLGERRPSARRRSGHRPKAGPRERL